MTNGSAPASSNRVAAVMGSDNFTKKIILQRIGQRLRDLLYIEWRVPLTAIRSKGVPRFHMYKYV